MLMSFQERARLKDAAKGKKVRRMVFGLREVHPSLPPSLPPSITRILSFSRKGCHALERLIPHPSSLPPVLPPSLPPSLPQVMRGIRSRKIQFVVIAPDIERSPALDQEIAEIR